MSKKNPVVDAAVQEVVFSKAATAFDAELKAFAASFDAVKAKEDANYQQRFNDQIGQVVGILESAKLEIRKVMKR